MKSMARRIKNKSYLYKRKRIVTLDSRDFRVKSYGNDYGGFNVCTDIFSEGELIVYSFGIGEDLSFSEAIMDDFEPYIFAFDPTPKSIKYVNEHKLNSNEKFHFLPVGLSDKDEIAKFYLPINDEYVSGSAISHDSVKEVGIDVKMRCLNTLVNYYGHSKIDLLKMDIEGTEFAVIESLENCCVPIEQICVEVHDRFFKDGLTKLRAFLRKLRAMDYILIYVSERGEEFTFIKRH